jgi:CRISPR/Cas system-associated endonuclease Cas1
MHAYRYLIDDFLIEYCWNLRAKDFIVKNENLAGKKKGKRVYLSDIKTRDLTNGLNQYFEKTVEVPRIRVGERQTIETLINEEALLFAKHLRNEKEIWSPRIAPLKVV